MDVKWPSIEQASAYVSKVSYHFGPIEPAPEAPQTAPGDVFTYGLAIRPVSFATVPSGYLVPLGRHSDFPHGTVSYATPLSPRDAMHYDLYLIPTDSQYKKLKEIAFATIEPERFEIVREYLDSDDSTDRRMLRATFANALDDALRESYGYVYSEAYDLLLDDLYAEWEQRALAVGPLPVKHEQIVAEMTNKIRGIAAPEHVDVVVSASSGDSAKITLRVNGPDTEFRANIVRKPTGPWVGSPVLTDSNQCTALTKELSDQKLLEFVSKAIAFSETSFKGLIDEYSAYPLTQPRDFFADHRNKDLFADLDFNLEDVLYHDYSSRTRPVGLGSVPSGFVSIDPRDGDYGSVRYAEPLLPGIARNMGLTYRPKGWQELVAVEEILKDVSPMFQRSLAHGATSSSPMLNPFKSRIEDAAMKAVEKRYGFIATDTKVKLFEVMDRIYIALSKLYTQACKAPTVIDFLALVTKEPLVDNASVWAQNRINVNTKHGTNLTLARTSYGLWFVDALRHPSMNYDSSFASVELTTDEALDYIRLADSDSSQDLLKLREKQATGRWVDEKNGL